MDAKTTQSTQDEFEHASCVLCGRDDGEPVVESRDFLHGMPGLFTVVRCPGCTLLRTDPRPTRPQMPAYYPADAYLPFVKHPPDRDRNLASRLFWSVMEPKPTPKLAPGVLLEVGAAHGAYLAQMKARGWSVSGYDFSAQQAETARTRYGVQVDVADLESHEYAERDLDLVTAWMVIEHLYDPVAFLSRLRETVKSDGWLALSVPDAGASLYRVFGSYCYGWQLPTHLFHFDRSTLTQVLEAAGWTVDRIRDQYSVSMWTSSLDLKATHSPSPQATLANAVANRIPKPALAALGLGAGLLRQSGKLVAWARPRGR